MLDPRITATPLRAMAKLRARNIRRIPDDVLDDLRKQGRKGNATAFIRSWLDGEMFTRHRKQWVLNSFIPPFPGPAYERMFDNLFSGRHLSPVSAFIAITAACPCSCFHCSAQRNCSNEFSTKEWIDTLQQLQQLGTSIVGFTGGEPCTRPDLPELIAESSRLGMASILFTSGVSGAPQQLPELAKNGLWACCTSLDFDNAAEHNAMRGTSGAFDDALATVRASRQNGLYTMISSVATRSFIESGMYRRVYTLAENLDVHEYRLVEPMPCGSLSDAGDNMLLTTEHTQTLRTFHTETNRLQKHPKVCAFNQIESPEIFGCGAGTQHLYIQPDGTVCPCDFTPLGFGSLRDEPLDKIWLRMNKAMGDNPRTHCFIQKHHRLVNQHAAEGFPLSVETSQKICDEVGAEPMPGYFAMVTGQPQENAE